MSDVITYVVMDAHKRELHMAMLVGAAKTPVTWVVANEAQAIERLRRRLEREAPGQCRSATRPGRAATDCSDS